MIALKCPHCHVGLKVDEGKIPLGITFFKCPKCGQVVRTPKGKGTIRITCPKCRETFVRKS